jgi:alanine dehydrogenase
MSRRSARSWPTATNCRATAQLHAYPAPHVLEGTRAGQHMLDLADIVAAGVSGRRSPTDITLFCSVGLAGTEVAVADALLRQSAIDRANAD